MLDDGTTRLHLDETEPGALPPSEGREHLAESGAEYEETQGAADEARAADELRRQVAELSDRYLRAVAELENYRRHVQEDRARQLQYANEQLLRELIPVVDDLERVLEHAPAEDPLRRGVEMTLAALLRVMEAFGAEPFSALGEEFDPYRHEAVECVATDAAPENTVIRERQRGWMYRDRLLRPARVTVSASP